MNLFVVVSGLPASGKSTLARQIAATLDLHCADKDDFLERLFEANEVSESPHRRSLSREADLQLIERVSQLSGGVVVSWWRHPKSNVDSGTPVGWLSGLPGTVIEIHCLCSPDKAADRFLERKRHPAHLDSRWSRCELIAQFSEQAAYGPIYADRAICIRTDDPSITGDVTNQILRRIAG